MDALLMPFVTCCQEGETFVNIQVCWPFLAFLSLPLQLDDGFCVDASV